MEHGFDKEKAEGDYVSFKLGGGALVLGLLLYIGMCIYAPFHETTIHGEHTSIGDWIDTNLSNKNALFRLMEAPNMLAIDVVGPMLDEPGALDDHASTISTNIHTER